MFLLLSEALNFLNSTPSSRNFIEGEKLVNAGHFLYCGILSENDEQYELLAYCLQSSDIRGNPHELTAIINKNGQVVSTKCSCTAGLSERCKHITGVLIFCTRNDLSLMKQASCTDRKCLWSTPRSVCLEQYNPKPLKDHDCFEIVQNHAELSLEVKTAIKEKLYSRNLASALSEHAYDDK